MMTKKQEHVLEKEKERTFSLPRSKTYTARFKSVLSTFELFFPRTVPAGI